MNIAKTYFDKHAKEWNQDAYAESSNLTPIGYQRVALTIELIEQHADGRSLNILDIGCGDGTLAIMLAMQGHHVTGIDQSKEMLKLALERKSNFDSDNVNNVDFIHLSIEDLDEKYQPSSFDVIVSLGVIYYLPSDRIMLRNIVRLIKNDGKAIISCRNKLFNVFNGSNESNRIVKSNEISSLMREISDLPKTVPSNLMNDFVNKLQEIFPKIVNSNKESSRLLGLTTEMKNDFIATRQHTPNEFSKEASNNNLKVIGFYGIQPHFLFTNQSEEVNNISRVLSQCLTVFQKLPISLTWSSHFIALMEKEKSDKCL